MEENFSCLLKLLETAAAELSDEYGCRIEFSHSAGYPPVVNDPALYSRFLPALADGKL